MVSKETGAWELSTMEIRVLMERGSPRKKGREGAFMVGMGISGK